MISLNGKICNSSLKFCVKTFKCGYKTKPDSSISTINSVTKETGEIGTTNLLQNFSLGTYIGSNHADIRRRLLFTEQFSVRPMIVRCYTTGEKPPQKSGPIKDKSLDKSKPKTQIKRIDDDSVINQIMLDKYRVPEPTTTAEKVKEGVKDVYYFSAFAAAVAVAGALLFYVFRDLFSSKSPTRIYGRALKIVQANDQVIDALGSPIKGYGEETRRGRRRDVSHVEYIKDGVNYMRVKFYVQGPQGKGTVRLEVKENETGQFDFRYLLVELETYPMRSIILIDQR